MTYTQILYFNICTRKLRSSVFFSSNSNHVRLGHTLVFFVLTDICTIYIRISIYTISIQCDV